MRVSFENPLELPRQVRWAEWDGYNPGKLILGSVANWTISPDSDEYGSPYAAERTLRNVPAGKTLGFFWRRAPQRTR